MQKQVKPAECYNILSYINTRRHLTLFSGATLDKYFSVSVQILGCSLVPLSDQLHHGPVQGQVQVRSTGLLFQLTLESQQFDLLFCLLK